MIIFDFSQTCFSALSILLYNIKEPMDENTLRHIILNILLSNNKKFKKQYGEILLACDNGSSWRKKIHPHYKFKRKKVRDKQNIDWDRYYKFYNVMKDELADVFGYKVISVDKAEGDDIIGVICNNIPGTHIIISSDKDFIQLQDNNKVKQYDSIHDIWVTSPNPKKYLFEHIIKGDVGDGIPNIKSPINTFYDGVRQKSITKNFLRERNFTNEEKKRFQLNRNLIDLTKIPQEIQNKIIEEYKKQENNTKKDILKYMANNKLTKHMENIGDF